MIITNRQLIVMLNNIGTLKNECSVMPLKVSFTISRAMKILESEYKTYIEELQKWYLQSFAISMTKQETPQVS